MLNKLKIDLRDIWLLRKYKYCYTGKPGNEYLTRSCYKTGKKQSFKLHREILGVSAGEIVDHIDGNRLNNSRNNLRICTQTQNNWNSSKRKNGKSLWKGVYPIHNTTDKRWAVSYRCNRKSIFLGCFTHQEDAAMVYNEAVAVAFGEYAKFNESDLNHKDFQPN